MGVADPIEIRPDVFSLGISAHKFGYTPEVVNVTDTLQNSDNKLFLLMFRSGHCLRTLLPDLNMIDIILCTICSSGASFNWLQCSYKLYKRSFVNRCLFLQMLLMCFALCVSHFQSTHNLQFDEKVHCLMLDLAFSAVFHDVPVHCCSG